MMGNMHALAALPPLPMLALGILVLALMMGLADLRRPGTSVGLATILGVAGGFLIGFGLRGGIA